MTFESGEVLQTSTSVITEADKAVLYLTINIQGRLPFGNEMFMLDAFKERFVYPHYFLVQILYTKHYHCACVKKTQSYLISVFILLHYPQFSSCLVLSNSIIDFSFSIVQSGYEQLLGVSMPTIIINKKPVRYSVEHVTKYNTHEILVPPHRRFKVDMLQVAYDDIEEATKFEATVDSTSIFTLLLSVLCSADSL